MCRNSVRHAALATITALSLLSIQLAFAAAPTNACALLSQAQLADILGVEMDAGKNLVTADDCRYSQQSAKPGADVALLQINLTKAQSFEMGKTAIPNWTKTPLNGIGDDAYSADRGGKITFPISPSLSVTKGSVSFVIAAKLPKATLEQTKDLEKKIAAAILAKL
jgi:hypothetical protein